MSLYYFNLLNTVCSWLINVWRIVYNALLEETFDCMSKSCKQITLITTV